MIRSKVDTWRVQETASPIIGMGDLKISHQPWRLQAACAEVGTGDTWFPAKGADEYTKPAKTICRTCPVKVECLQYALDTEQRYGVWGGMSQNELAKLRRLRAGIEYKHAHTCEQCGTAFRSHSKRSRFCGKQCIYRAAQERKAVDSGCSVLGRRATIDAQEQSGPGGAGNTVCPGPTTTPNREASSG